MTLLVDTRGNGAQTGVVLEDIEKASTTKHTSKVKVMWGNKEVKGDYEDLSLREKKVW